MLRTDTVMRTEQPCLQVREGVESWEGGKVGVDLVTVEIEHQGSCV